MDSDNSGAALKKTPLHPVHAARAGVKLVDFGGWEMPLQYSGGILAEHRAVRTSAGLFDVSHMGEILVEGGGARVFLDGLLTNAVAGAENGRCIYSPMCRHDGGTVDDLLVYVLTPESCLLVVNAANTKKDLDWIVEQAAGWRADSTDGAAGAGGGTGGPGGIGVKGGFRSADVPRGSLTIRDVSAEWAQIALQGPRSQDILAPLAGGFDPAVLPYYRHAGMVRVAGIHTLVSRTGYTGEDGFELYCAPAEAAALWQSLEEKGAVPCGLGARDILRLEARLPLYGHELSDDIDPLEAGLGMFVKTDGREFPGRDVLERRRREGTARRIYGLEMTDGGVPRQGYPVSSGGRPIGSVTSGGRSPATDRFIALALLERDSVDTGRMVEVEIHGRARPARVVKTPFYRRAG